MPEGQRAWWSAMYRPGVCVSVRLDPRNRNEWVHGHVPRYETAGMRLYNGALPQSRVLVYVPRRGVLLFHTVDVLLRHNVVKQPRTRRMAPPPPGSAAPMTAERPQPELVATDSDASYPTVDSKSSSPCSRCDAETDAADIEEPCARSGVELERDAPNPGPAVLGRDEATSSRKAPGVHKAAGVRKSSGSRKASRGKSSGKRRADLKASGGQSSGHASGGHKTSVGERSGLASGWRTVSSGQPSGDVPGDRQASGLGTSAHASAVAQASVDQLADLASGRSHVTRGCKVHDGSDGGSA